MVSLKKLPLRTILWAVGKHANTAIIVAAGSGNRFGTEKPKQFLLLEGREILDYSVARFASHPLIDQVIIVTAAEHRDHVATNYPNCQVVVGGAVRSESVANGLAACARDTEIVLVHDAARPLLPARIIDACLQQLETLDGVAPATKPVDTIVLQNESEFHSLNRDDLWVVQTPQCFHRDILQAAYAAGGAATDEMGLVKQALPEARLRYIEGAPETMKITHALDLEIIRLFLKNM